MALCSKALCSKALCSKRCVVCQNVPYTHLLAHNHRYPAGGPATNVGMAATPGPVTVVGAGIAGAACVAALQQGGVPVRWFDRAAAPGGRMASPVLRGRRVDIGASYFTVRDEGFAAVVDRWARAGLARPWTDTFAVFAPADAPSSSTGPLRWSAPGGLQSLVQAVAGEVVPEAVRLIETLPDGDVVLAMPDPDAAQLVDVPDPVAYQPAIAVVCGFTERRWSFRDGAFVNGHAAIEFVADDGARRGDDAPVLVVHTTAELARRHAADPSAAVGEVLEALQDLLGVGRPEWSTAHRWAVAKPAGGHPATFGLIEPGPAQVIGLAGDQWCGSAPPRIESAWRSGTDVAGAILDRLGTSKS
jgi:renalase